MLALEENTLAPHYPVEAPVPQTVALYELDRSEKAAIERLIDMLAPRFSMVESSDFAEECAIHAQELPIGLRRFLYHFKTLQLRKGTALIRGYQMQDHRIGDTPSHWDMPWENPKVLREEIYQCLITALVGDIFGWVTQENGRFMRHIVPIKKDAYEQLGAGSAVDLVWHNEEAFHERRATFLSLLCYRNEEQARTITCSIDDFELDPSQENLLRQKRFVIQPDKAHLPEQNDSQHWQLSDEQFSLIKSHMENPPVIPAIYGPAWERFIQVDQAFMEVVDNDPATKAAIDGLYEKFDRHKAEIVMQPGDLVIIDNDKAVHGRSKYKPNYGPRQRWIRRVNVTADIRKTQDYRANTRSRQLY
ncbi:TauD/TfdA family dioxygenase [Aestuariispira insulae]|uniref:Fe(II)/alpha-ketoglutarate-dependent arginine beta-hydroxylase n=1 Tax=Aestuariispira insulae TaxID=1461337 RepID=A0A3D9H5R4_9PROT|nr:TauD/TfdA family dioxygenase [Aestuariispira insulae]RED44845.1 Fe(II)/alpha-ketoglutarate-dependent arginine beta-hydroxylase [Aestuariispira insulae]